MSTVVDGTRRLTPTQRVTKAAQQVATTLGLEDQKRVSAALAEAAAEAVRRDSLFAARVRIIYNQMTPAPATHRTTTPGRGTRAAPDVELVPIKQVEGWFLNPGAPPDPYFLMELYGPKQLPLALQRYTVARLREAVELVQQRNPGTRPSGKTRQYLVDYIVEHVSGQR
jgi:hypothetical protein